MKLLDKRKHRFIGQLPCLQKYINVKHGHLQINKQENKLQCKSANKKTGGDKIKETNNRTDFRC